MTNELSNEQSYFLSILKDHINHNSSKYIDDIDWNVIGKYADVHQLFGIFFYQCKDYFKDSSNYDTYLSSYYQILKAYKKREDYYNKVNSAFKKANIKYILVKGEVIKDYYPIPELRQMSDIDILMSIEDRNIAHEIMLELKFDRTSDGNEWAYFKQDLEYELHNKLSYDSQDKYGDYFNDFNKYIKNKDDENVLDINFHFIYLIAHIRKHLLYSGVGFRQFVDLAILVNSNVLDFNWIENQLNKIGLIDFAGVCFELIKLWFDIDIPIHRDNINQEFYLEVTHNIFENGSFGFQNKDNRNENINEISKSMAVSGTSLNSAAYKRNKKDILPSYEDMCKIDHFSFLRGRPYLLPVAWMYRLYRGITLKRMNQAVRMMKDVKSSITQHDEINSRVDYFRKWKI